jgi:hypothetical protein
VPGSTNIEHLGNTSFEAGISKPWRLQLTRDLVSEPSSEQAVSLVLGQKPEEARQLLMENLDISGEPRLVTSPNWWPVVPFIPIRIDVISTTDTQASNPTIGQGLD